MKNHVLIVGVLLLFASFALAAAPTTRPVLRDADAAATRHVILVDSSGSMMPYAGTARRIAYALIETLTEKQQLSVVFCSEGKAWSDGKLAAADAKRKQLAYEWIHNTLAQGPDALVEGLALAWTMRPELVWVITDGEIDKPQLVLDRVRIVEKTLPVHINCIIINGDETSPIGQAAAISGGRMMSVRVGTSNQLQWSDVVPETEKERDQRIKDDETLRKGLR